MNWKQLWPRIRRVRRDRQPRTYRPVFEKLERRETPAAFTPGNLVIYRVGDGSAALGSTGTAVFLDEYTTAGALVQSIALPTNTSGLNNRLVASGSATSEGLLTLSTDGQYLVLTGYDAALSTSGVASSSVNRVVGLVRYDSTIDTTTSLTTFGGNNIRSAIKDGNNLWLAGASTGVVTATVSATGANFSVVASNFTNLRQLEIFNNQLYVSSGSSTIRLGSVGTGLPTTAGSTITSLPGFPTSSLSSYTFYLADLDAGVSGADTLYVADDNSVASGGGVKKYSLVSGSWVANGTLQLATTRGLTATVSGTNVTFYLTANANTLQTFTDTSGYNSTITGTLTTLANAGTNQAFRGVVFAPTSPVNINVLPSSYTTPEDTNKVLTGISVNDAAAGNITVTLSVTSGTLSLSESVASGLTSVQITGNNSASVTITAPVAAINATLADAAGLTYIPAANFNGTATLTMLTNDGTTIDSDTSTITISAVNDAPVITVPGAQTTNEDTAVVFSSGNSNLISISDVDAVGTNVVKLTLTATNGTVSLSGVSGLTFTTGDGTDDASMVITGTVSNINTALAGMSFTPTLNFNGPGATLQVDVDDLGNTGTGGALTDSKSVSFPVDAVNDPPVNTVPAGPLSLQQDTSLVVSGVSVSDADAGTNPVQVTFHVLHGTLAINVNVSGGVVSGEVSGNNTATVVLTASQAKINATLASASGLTYTPGAGYTGTDTLTMTSDDQGNTGGSSTPDVDTVTLNISQSGANLPPINTLPSTFSATEDVLGSLTGISVTDPDAGVLDVQVIFSVASGTLTITTTGIAGGVTTAQVSNNGTSMVTITASMAAINTTLANVNGLKYLSAANGNGSVSLAMITNDLGHSGTIGGAQSDVDFATINIAAANDAPANTVPGAQTTNEDTALVFSTGNGNALSIADGDAGSSAVQVTLTATNGTVTLAPGFSGLSFTGGDGTADATMTFTGTVSAITTALNGLSFIPTANANGSASLQIVTNDQGNTGSGGALSDTDTVNITVNAVNDVPSFTKGTNQTVNEDAGPQTVNGWATAISKGPADESGQTLTFVVTGNTNPDLFTASGAPAIAADGILTYTAAANANGIATITVVLKDDGGTAIGGVDTTASQIFTITVNAVNDAPSFFKGPDLVVNMNSGAQTVTGWATGISRGPSDEAIQSLTFQVTGNTNAGLFSAGPSIAANGTLTFTSAANASGSATITVILQDGGSGTAPNVNTSASQTFTITVNAVNQAPVNTVPGAQTTNRNTALPISGVSITDDSSTLQVTLTVAHGTLAIGTTGLTVTGNNTATVTASGSLSNINTALASLNYTPSNNYFGPDTLTLVTNDNAPGIGGPYTVRSTVAITVKRTGGIVAVGAEAGSKANAKVFDALTGTKLFEINPYPEASKFQGGVRVAVADMDQDGTADIITVPGAGIVNEIRIFSGVDGTRLVSHLLDGQQPFGATFKSGAYVAAGDVNGDTFTDLVVAPQAGGNGLVRFLDGQTGFPSFTFRPYSTAYTGGIQVAVGNVDAVSPGLEIVVAPTGALPKPSATLPVPVTNVRVYSSLGQAMTGAGRNFKPIANYRNGFTLAVANLNGIGGDEIIIGTQAGAPKVVIIDGDTGSTFQTLTNATFGFAATYKGPVRVGVGHINDAAIVDLFIAPGKGESPDLRAFENVLITPTKVVEFQPQDGFNGFWLGAS